MMNYDELTREEKVALYWETRKAADLIGRLVKNHCEEYRFDANGLLAETLGNGIPMDTIIRAVAARIHEIPDQWDRRIDGRVYAWAAANYTARNDRWDISLNSMHSVYLNAFARAIMKATGA